MKVKKHTRKRKNGVTVVKQHMRSAGAKKFMGALKRRTTQSSHSERLNESPRTLVSSRRSSKKKKSSHPFPQVGGNGSYPRKTKSKSKR